MILNQYLYPGSHTANPGNTNAAIGEMFDKYLIPQMFAEVAQGKRTPADAARSYHSQINKIFAKWRKQKKV